MNSFHYFLHCSTSCCIAPQLPHQQVCRDYHFWCLMSKQCIYMAIRGPLADAWGPLGSWPLWMMKSTPEIRKRFSSQAGNVIVSAYTLFPLIALAAPFHSWLVDKSPVIPASEEELDSAWMAIMFSLYLYVSLSIHITQPRSSYSNCLQLYPGKQMSLNVPLLPIELRRVVKGSKGHVATRSPNMRNATMANGNG